MLIRFADVDGVSTRYLVAGREGAPVLLLVHGLTLTCDIWAPMIERLARDHLVLAPDMLGHGFTLPMLPPEGVDLVAKVAHLLRFVQTVAGASRISVAGSSYGALVACNLYMLAPQLIERLVLIGSGSCFADEAQLLKAVDRAHASYDGLMSASTPDGWREHLAGSVHDPATIPPALPYVLGLAYAQPWIAAYWRETIAAMSDPVRFRPFRVLERLDLLRVPTLVVWGVDDRGALIAAGRAAVERMPDACMAELDRCGHFPMFEQPDATDDAVQAFLARRASAQLS